MIRRVHLLLLRVYQRLPRRGRRFVVRRLAPGFTVGSMCVVERADGRILMVQHSYRHRWGMPGGLLKRGELPAEAARREAMEEVGLAIALLGEPVVVVEPDPRRVDVVFRCRPITGQDLDALRPRSPEIIDLGWFHPDSLPEVQPETATALVSLARRVTEDAGGGEAQPAASERS